MERRRWLIGAGVGVAAVGGAFGAWLVAARERGPVLVLDVEQEREVGAARRKLKRTLVIVSPESYDQESTFGHLLGEFLNHGSDVQIAPLDNARVVCARTSDIAAAHPHYTPSAPEASRAEPLFLLVSEDESRVEEIFWAPQDIEALGRIGDETISRRIEEMARIVGGALGTVPSTEVAASASRVRAILDAPPKGTRWAQTNECGYQIEGELERAAFGCGMGNLPARSRRFLHFVTKS